MALIHCPECNQRISDKADACPHCGLPSRLFFAEQSAVPDIERVSETLDLSELRNEVIAFDHSYQTLFGANHYITARELTLLVNSFSLWASRLSEKAVYDYINANAPKNAVDMDTVKSCLRRYESLAEDAAGHNERYIDRIVTAENEYFDAMLSGIDPNIRLDEEQRRAVVTDDDYCLLVAGAGAGKTTTMAAKVKYLIDKKHIAPEDIIVISYTRKAIDELR